MKHLKILVTVAMVMGLLQPLYAATQESAAAPQPVSEEFATALRAKERSELGAELRRNRSGSITFMPLEAFQALQELSPEKRAGFHISEKELAQYAGTLYRHQEIAPRVDRPDAPNSCAQNRLNHAEYNLIRDEEIAADGPKVSLKELVERAEVAFVAQVEETQVGFGFTLGTLTRYMILDVLHGSVEAGQYKEYFLNTYDFWLDGQHLCQGWKGQHRERPGDQVLVLAALTPVGNLIVFNVFPVVDGVVLPEPLPFLDGKSLDLSEVER